MRNFAKSSIASGKRRSGYMARAAIICMAILCIVALSVGCSSQSEGEPKAAGAPSVASPLQAKGLLELDQASIEEVLGGFGLAGVEEIAGKSCESSWADEHWYRCQVNGEDALVRVSAVKVKRYGDGDTAVSGGSRYQLGGYCVYLDAVTSHLGIEATYDAFVEYLEDNGPVGL